MANATSIMCDSVVSVTPATPVPAIAALLSKHRISAVPVIEASGKLVGMVSEGDLMTPFVKGNETQRDWWLGLLAEGENLAPEFLDYIKTDHRTAADVMTRDVVAISGDMNVADIAELLIKHRIKRVPVLRDGKVAGIVSRADIVRAVSAKPDLA